jgi:hypothetical protein
MKISMERSDSDRSEDSQSREQGISPEEAIEQKEEELESWLPLNSHESVSSLLNRVFGAPECDECGRRFFHPSYKQLGNTIFKTSAKSSFYVGLTYAILPFIWKGMAIRKAATKLCKKAEYDDWADILKKGSMESITEHTLFENLDDSWKEVQWEEKEDGSVYCYEWPECKNYPYNQN